MSTAQQSKCGVAGILAISALMSTGIRAANLGPLPFKSECTIDGASFPCSPGVPNRASGGVIVSLAPANYLDVTVYAEANVFSGVNTTASADVDSTFWLTTEGPVRDGLARVRMHYDGDGNLSGSLASQYQVATLTSSLLSKGREPGSCTDHEIPVSFEFFLFRLGEPFKIKMQAGVKVESLQGIEAGWSNYPTIILELWEIYPPREVQVTRSRFSVRSQFQSLARLAQ